MKKYVENSFFEGSNKRNIKKYDEREKSGNLKFQSFIFLNNGTLNQTNQNRFLSTLTTKKNLTASPSMVCEGTLRQTPMERTR